MDGKSQTVRRAIAMLMSVSDREEWLSGVMPEASFGKMVSAVRNRLGLSLQEVADACHVSKTHIWEIEQERTCNPSARLVWDLSQVLSIDPAFLLKAAALSTPPAPSP